MARSRSRERRDGSPRRRHGRRSRSRESRRDRDGSRRDRDRDRGGARDRRDRSDSRPQHSDSHRSDSHRSSRDHEDRHERRGSHGHRRSRSPAGRGASADAARAALRGLLTLAPALEDEVAKIAQNLDAGRSISIGGLRDPSIRTALGAFLDALPGSRQSSSGKRYLSRGAPSAEALVKEQAGDKASRGGEGKQDEAGAARRRPDAPEATSRSVDPKDETRPLIGAALPPKPIIGPALPPKPVIGPQLPPGVAPAPPSPRSALPNIIGPIGPSAPPPGFALPPTSPSSSSSSIGPALPAEEEEPETAGGPSPPATIAAPPPSRPSAATPAAEVERLLSVLSAHAAENALREKEGVAPLALDAYELLGLPPSAAPKEAARRYRQLSLQVHPDRCRHPRAHEAFDGLKRAAQALADVDARALLDQQREEEEEMVREVTRREEEERRGKWRRAYTGESVREAGAAARPDAQPTGSASAAAPTREAWMTELPPARARAAGSLFGGGVATGGGGATFSQSKQSDIDPSWGKRAY